MPAMRAESSSQFSRRRATPWRWLRGCTASSTQVGALVAELHHRKAGQAQAVAGHQRQRLGVADQASDLGGVVGPAQAGLDQVARHLRHGRAHPAPGRVEAGSRRTTCDAFCQPADCRATAATVGRTPHAWSAKAMNGAESLVRTLVDSGVDVCFTNPGTSEMHFVAALDKRARACAACSACSRAWSPARPTATTAWPAARPRRCCTWGPGLANGLANLHNAKKARSGIVNIVGEHATYHLGARRAADLRHRPAWRGRCRTGCRPRPRRATWPRDGAPGDAGGAHAAGPHRHADPAGRHRLERGRRPALARGRTDARRPARRPR